MDRLDSTGTYNLGSPLNNSVSTKKKSVMLCLEVDLNEKTVTLNGNFSSNISLKMNKPLVSSYKAVKLHRIINNLSSMQEDWDEV